MAANVGQKVGEVFNVWVVYEGGDERHHGRPSTTLAFTDEAAANESARGRGWYGGKAHVGSFRAIMGIHGRTWLVTEEIRDINHVQFDYEATVREKALAKLSDEEKKALGV